ncbi:hypothetical protein DCAR_0104735 [Daucus carota subsp. sativus]|uniref:Uncharacterized protein n=1 Tax=Daucus carota subsp. sativus TaxID=79200 RepID=A0A166J2P3_DAUCS|nr:hypothetical protein DCAR_0104735 [Daucus carota subsp. sativus]
MEFMWDLPDHEAYKINIHCEVSDVPSPVGNTVAIAAIIRGPAGSKLWGMEGPANNLTLEQGIMAAIQAACVYADAHVLEPVHIETTHVGIFELVSAQDQFIIPHELLEAFRLFNSLHANNADNIDGANPRRISWIPHHMNSTAVYMAEYGMKYLTDTVELPGASTLGNLQYFLERDMGRVLPNPEMVILPNLGLGDVEDGPPPPPPAKRIDTPIPLLIEKGKDALYGGFMFYKDGKFSDQAISILEAGSLVKVSPVFAEKAINLEAHAINGLLVKDVLNFACLGCLSVALEPGEDVPKPTLPPLVNSPKPLSPTLPAVPLNDHTLEDLHLLPVTDLLVEMDKATAVESQVELVVRVADGVDVSQ